MASLHGCNCVANYCNRLHAGGVLGAPNVRALQVAVTCWGTADASQIVAGDSAGADAERLPQPSILRGRLED